MTAPRGRGPDRGHELLPHTADLILTAWGPSLADCISEAVYALVESFVESFVELPRHHGRTLPHIDGPPAVVPFSCGPAADHELLVRTLDEVIYLLDVSGVVPTRVELAGAPDGGLTGRFEILPIGAVSQVGPVPKAITRHELSVTRVDGTWRCRVTVDV